MAALPLGKANFWFLCSYMYVVVESIKILHNQVSMKMMEVSVTQYFLCSTVPKVGKLVVCDSHILLYEWMTAKGTQCMSMSGL